MALKSDLGKNLGCETNQFGFYKISDNGSTNIPGVFACGDITKFESVLLASATGVTGGSGVVFELLNERLHQ